MTLLDTPAVFTREMKRAAAEREVKLRERVYPRFIEQKKMTQAQADRELGAMRAIASDYAKPPLTDRQVQLIRHAIVHVAESHALTDEEVKELHGINDTLRDLQR